MQSTALREAVFAELLAQQEDTVEARIAVACLTGVMIQNWTRARELLAPLQQRVAEARDPQLQTKLEAIDIIAGLGSWDKRAEAARSFKLAELGTKITDLLLLAANSPNRRLRRSVVSALAEIADPRATDHLIRALDDDYTKVRRRAITGLTRIGEPAVDALIEAADSDQIRIRRYAIVCLGHIGVARAKPVIIDALNDSEEDVRRQALRALKEHATLDDLAALQQFLREAQPRNAIEALEVVTALGAPAIEALRQMARDEENPAAALVIAQRGDDDARELLVEKMNAGGEDMADAVEYLRELRDPRCVPHLIHRFREMTDWEGMFVAHELGVIGTEEAVAALIEALDRDNHLIRRGAARGLDEAMDPVSIVPLVKVLEDEDDKTRRQAADTLCRFGEAALGPLTQALSATDADDGRRRSILTRVLAEVQAAIDRQPSP
jgi:HEAT repeat protein